MTLSHYTRTHLNPRFMSPTNIDMYTYTLIGKVVRPLHTINRPAWLASGLFRFSDNSVMMGDPYPGKAMSFTLIDYSQLQITLRQRLLEVDHGDYVEMRTVNLTTPVKQAFPLLRSDAMYERRSQRIKRSAQVFPPRFHRDLKLVEVNGEPFQQLFFPDSRIEELVRAMTPAERAGRLHAIAELEDMECPEPTVETPIKLEVRSFTGQGWFRLFRSFHEADDHVGWLNRLSSSRYSHERIFVEDVMWNDFNWVPIVTL